MTGAPHKATAFRGVKAGMDEEERSVSSAGEFRARVRQGRLLGGGWGHWFQIS